MIGKLIEISFCIFRFDVLDELIVHRLIQMTLMEVKRMKLVWAKMTNIWSAIVLRINFMEVFMLLLQQDLVVVVHINIPETRPS